MLAAGPAKNKVERRSDVDVLRAAVVLGLIFFHTAKIFDLLPYYVKNEQTSILLMALVGFVSQWGMPLLFFMAGIATWHSLGVRTPTQFVRERFRRLVVPFIFGMCVIVPPMRYYNLLTNPDYHDSFRQFYPKFFSVVLKLSFPRFIQPDPAVGIFETAHLWFLYYLFVFSLMALPLFVCVRSDAGQRLVARLAGLCRRRGAILLLAIPVVSIELFVGLGESVGWNRYSFLSFLIFGYLFASNAGFEELAKRDSTIGLIAGTITVAAFFWVSVLAWQAGTDPSHGYALESVLWRLFKGCSSWFWVIAIGGLGQRYKQHRASREQRADLRAGEPGPAHKVLQYANEAVMPFYVIHQAVIVIIGFYVVKWDAGVMAKYWIISLASLAGSLLLYETLARRTSVTRFLFGMKPIAPREASGPVGHR
ncbi:MAG TPA: acyltransferase [Blastocatellia bacterium]|nr:acyltransferase [Blastocatellia bacterium]